GGRSERHSGRIRVSRSDTELTRSGIRARVDGFLDKRLYTEGDLVHAGQAMFQIDRKPFEAQFRTARGQLAQQQAALEVAEAYLARVKPLAEQNAASRKDLDDAIGSVQKLRIASSG